MTPAARKKTCRHDDCDTEIVIAYAPHVRRWVPLEATDVPAFSDQSAGALVLVGNQAWRPLDLIEEWQATYELSEPNARTRVGDYPFHPPPRHSPSDQDPSAGTDSGTTNPAASAAGDSTDTGRTTT